MAGILAVGFLFLKVKYGLLLAVLISNVRFSACVWNGNGPVSLGRGEAVYRRVHLRGGTFNPLSVVTQVSRQLIQPKIVGDSMGLPPLLTLFLLYLGFKVKGNCRNDSGSSHWTDFY